MAKIKVILDLKPPINQKKIKIFLGHTGYYRKFIQHYSNINFPIDKLLKKEVEFQWSQECNESFELLKKNGRSTYTKISILVMKVPCPC
jgi:hypothetical protein